MERWKWVSYFHRFSRTVRIKYGLGLKLNAGRNYAIDKSISFEMENYTAFVTNEH